MNSKTYHFVSLLVAAGFLLTYSVSAEQQTLRGHIPPAVKNLHLQPTGMPPADQQLNLAIGLPLQNKAVLDALLHDLYDPSSPRYHQYITPDQFAEQFGATEADYQAVIDFAKANRLQVMGHHKNRIVLSVRGAVADIEKAFHLRMRTYKHPHENRDFYAPDAEPSLDLATSVLSIDGLHNFSIPRPMSHQEQISAVTSAATPNTGSGPSGNYWGNDFRNAYVPGTTLTGAGQNVGLLQFDGYYAKDISNYLAQTHITTSVILTNVPVNGGVSTPGDGNGEVCLDIEMAIAMAPGLSHIYVYEAPNPTAWSTILSKIANDNTCKQISCSWGGGGPDSTSENILHQMAAQGQSFFNASGDNDSFVGSANSTSSNHPGFPTGSTNVTSVGGTTLTMNGTGASYASETVWNSGGGGSAGGNEGSSGGISTDYTIPACQQGISMTTNGGSTTKHNVPDVAMVASGIRVYYNNGSSGSFGGTSCAAPLWAGFTALVNQQAAAYGSPSVGFLNPALYAIGKGANYTACFHDITTGNNTCSNFPTQFNAVSGYDLCTGWGTPTGTNLINALAPRRLPIVSFTASPTNGYAPLQVVFTDNSTGSITNRHWVFGDGKTFDTAGLTSVTNQYANSGSYTVTLVASGNSGSSTNVQTGLIHVMAPTAPAVANQGATASGYTSATLSGMLTGGGIANAWVCWGYYDAGTNSTIAWNNVLAVGSVEQSNVFTVSVTGLATNETYFYRCFVTNAVGKAWSASASSFSATPAPAVIIADGVIATNSGGTVTNYTLNGTNYTAHIFTSTTGTGTFSATSGGNAAVLVVGGGGGGGGSTGGGGGAGGCLYTNAFAVVAGNNYQVTVGSGGAGGINNAGVNGSNSMFGSLTAYGGGGGGDSVVTKDGKAGGSGGGGSYVGGFGNGGAATNGQGNAGGGATYWTSSHPCGGGGGAGNMGSNGTASALGNGGSGKSNDLSGVTTWYAGGGGGGNYNGPGGSGGTGGGGRAAGNALATANNGVANTGGGGGGMGQNRATQAGSGGSGIVIVRYVSVSVSSAIQNLAPSGITTNVATLNAVLSAASTNFAVTAYWGTTDGETNAGAWTYSAAVGSYTNVASTNIAYQVNGLSAGTTYYYTFLATNATTSLWAQPSWQFSTLGITTPVASFTATPNSGQSPLNVTFTDTSTGTITNRYWQFGDGGTSNTTASTVAHSYNNSGITPLAYNVTLTVSGPLGSSSTNQTKLITVTPHDSVGDGIPDAWRAKYFGGTGTTTNAQSSATGDADGTGQNNLLKYTADLNPTNPASRFAIIQINILTNDVDIVWIGGSNSWQEVQCNNDLANTNTWSTIFTNVPPTAITNALQHTGAKASTNLFYRIKAYRLAQ